MTEEISIEKQGNAPSREELISRLPIPGPGRPKLTEEEKAIRRAEKGAIQKYIKEYELGLAEALPEIEPVLKKKAIEGDIQAIKELHEVVGVKAGKGNQTIIPVQINFQSDKEEFI